MAYKENIYKMRIPLWNALCLRTIFLFNIVYSKENYVFENIFKPDYISIIMRGILQNQIRYEFEMLYIIEIGQI